VLQQWCGLRQGAGGLTGQVEKRLGGFLGTRLGPHQGLKAEGWHARQLAFAQLGLRKSPIVMVFERLKQGVCGVKGLQPHFAVTAVAGIAPGPSGGLHQQTEQTFGGAKVAGKQCVVRVESRHQRDVAKVMAFGNHLRAHQHIHLTRVYLGQLRLQRALDAGGVGVDAHDVHRPSVGPWAVGQQRRQQFFESLGTTA